MQVMAIIVIGLGVLMVIPFHVVVREKNTVLKKLKWYLWLLKPDFYLVGIQNNSWHMHGCIIINPRRAHALARVTVYSWSVCLCVCLSGLNLLLQASRATRYYMYVYFTMNARFNMCGVR